MKNKILALFASLSMSGFVFGDIQIGENVTIKGFIDASYQNTNSDVAGGDSSDLSLDEAEIDFLFNSGAVSARVDVDTASTVSGRSATDGFDIEQAHFTYSNDSGISVTIGRMGTTLGLEREDPSGLYTYSRAYQDNNYNFGNIDGGSLISRNDGVRLSYAADVFALTATVDQDVDANLEGNDVNYEISLAYTGMENLNLSLGYRNDKSGATDHKIWNVNAAYTVGKALLAADYSNINPSNTTARTVDAYLLLLDYDFSDKLGGAVRYSREDDYAATTQTSKWTIAPNYSITDNLGAIIEYSNIEVGGANNDLKQVAVELTYTF
jgi:predicted porin